MNDDYYNQIDEVSREHLKEIKDLIFFINEHSLEVKEFQLSINFCHPSEFHQRQFFEIKPFIGVRMASMPGLVFNTVEEVLQYFKEVCREVMEEKIKRKRKRYGERRSSMMDSQNNE